VADRAVRELNDPDGRLGGAAAKYLRPDAHRQHDPAVLARLAQGLEAWTGEPLELAFNLMMEYGDADSAPPVRKLLEAGRAPRPDRAVRALAEWAGEQGAAELAGPAWAPTRRSTSPSSPASARCGGATPRRAARSSRRPSPGSSPPPTAACAAAPPRRPATSDCPVAGVVALVDDREPSVRCTAMTAARSLALAAAADSIEAKLDDDDPDVRISAVLSLATLKPAARPTVERAIATEDCLWAKRKMESSIAPVAK
jgi:hypothetical protein